MTESSNGNLAGTPLAMPAEFDLARQMVRGSLWLVGLRWSLRLVGLISTLILARLLTPEDFGIVAMAMLFCGALQVVSDAGQNLVIIRHPAPPRALYDTAWTTSVLIGVALAAISYAVAPLTVFYFHEPRAVVVIQCLSLRALIAGFENPGTADFKRDLDFARQFRFSVYQKVGGFVTVVGAGLVLRNYWALVIGIVASRGMTVWLSYTMHPYRPRFSLSALREIWSFSFWVLTESIAFYATSKVDEAVVSGLTSASQMGRYSIASDVAAAPVMEIAFPMTQAQFPVLARIQNDVERVSQAFLGLISGLATICISTGAGVALVAPDLVAVALGSQWVDIPPLMVWLALESAVYHVANAVGVFYQVTNRPQLAARIAWLRCLLLVGALSLVAYASGGSLFAIAAARFAVSLALLPITFTLLCRSYPIKGREIAGTLWRPVAAAAAMSVAVMLLDDHLADLPAVLRLGAKAAIGAVSFVAAQLAVWVISRRPPGIEAGFVAALMWRIQRLNGHIRVRSGSAV